MCLLYRELVNEEVIFSTAWIFVYSMLLVRNQSREIRSNHTRPYRPDEANQISRVFECLTLIHDSGCFFFFFLSLIKSQIFNVIEKCFKFETTFRCFKCLIFCCACHIYGELNSTVSCEVAVCGVVVFNSII